MGQTAGFGYPRKQPETWLSPAEMNVEQQVPTLERVADIFDGYHLAEAWDEMFAAPGKPRAAYDALVSVLQPMDPGELRFRADQLARVFTDRGIRSSGKGRSSPA